MTAPMLPPAAAKLVAPFLGPRMQIAFVVANMDEALRFWTETMKIGPFVVVEEAMIDRRFIHRGKESPVQMSLAFSYLDDVQIEVICQTNNADSPYKEFLDSGQQGLHHVAFWPEDLESTGQELLKLGFQELCSAEALRGGGVVRYYTGPAHLGTIFELAPMTPERAEYFGGIKALADHWDGTRPVRKFRTRADYLASDDCKFATAKR